MYDRDEDSYAVDSELSWRDKISDEMDDHLSDDSKLYISGRHIAVGYKPMPLSFSTDNNIMAISGYRCAFSDCDQPAAAALYCKQAGCSCNGPEWMCEEHYEEWKEAF